MAEKIVYVTIPYQNTKLEIPARKCAGRNCKTLVLCLRDNRVEFSPLFCSSCEEYVQKEIEKKLTDSNG